MSNILLALMVFIAVDAGIYMMVDEECRKDAPGYKFIPAIGGWMVVAYCQGKGQQ